MSARGLTNGGAAQLGARQSSRGKTWWSGSRPTSGMETTRSGVWYGQRGDGCGRKRRSPPWIPCKHPPGRRAPRVHIVPTTESWHFGSDTRRLMAWSRRPAGTCSSSGAWGIPGATSEGRYQQWAHWKKWVGCRILLPAGCGDAQSGPHLRHWPAPTRVLRNSGASQGPVLVGHSGRHMGWQSYCSRAHWGWARHPPSSVADAVRGVWGSTPLSVTHTLSAGSWELRQGVAPMLGPRGVRVRGPTGTRMPSRGRLPPNSHGDRPQRLCQRPRTVACVEEGSVGGLALVGCAGQMARLVGSLDV